MIADVSLMCGHCGQRCGEAFRDQDGLTIDGRGQVGEERYRGTVVQHLRVPEHFNGSDAVVLLRWGCLHCGWMVHVTRREASACAGRSTRRVVLPATR